MKKLIALLLSLSLCFALCACGVEEQTPEIPENSTPEQEETPSEPEEEIEVPEEIEAKRGSVSDNNYFNEAFGIGFAADENWYFFDDEEIAATMQISAEQMFTEEYAEALENVQVIYDMYATNLLDGSTVNVNYENLGLVYGTIFDEEDYLKISKTQLEAQLAQADGVSIVECDLSTVSAGGNENTPCLVAEIDYGGISIYEIILAKKVGSWMGVMTLACADPNTVEALLEKVTL